MFCQPDIVLQAMKDEMERNMTELVYKDFDKPFFISYTVADMHSLHISATLGALISSGENKHKTWAARVMAGDYKVNDENFDGNPQPSLPDIPEYDLPVEDDYDGIRQALWVITNNIYKRAGAGYKNKMEMLERSGLSVEDLEIDDFSRAPVVEMIDTVIKPDPDIDKLEDLVKQLSEVYYRYPDIIDSEVTLNYIFATVYFVNSEGTTLKIPLQLSIISSSASIFDPAGKEITHHVVTFSRDIKELISSDSLEKDLNTLAANITAVNTADPLQENYSGPVLVQGQPALQMVYNDLFRGKNSLVAYRESLSAGPQNSVYYEQNPNTFETKLNKKVASENLTITTMPAYPGFSFAPLPGSFKVDAEGVMPEDSLVLIQNGILKNLLNDRTPTRSVPSSNGYKRFSLHPSFVSKSISPGILRVRYDSSQSCKGLKNTLIRHAREEGYEYALIVRSPEVSGSYYPAGIYKVDIESGDEKLVRSAYIKNVPDDLMKNVITSSDKEQVFSFLTSDNTSSSNNGINGSSGGIPVTVTGPGAFLFSEMEIEYNIEPLSGKKPPVASPLQE